MALSPRLLARRLLAFIRTDRGAAASLFALTFVSFAYFAQGGGPNQNSRFDLVRAIVDRHSVMIDAHARNTIDKAEREGHFYSDKAPGLSFAAAAPYEVIEAVRGVRPMDAADISASLWFLTTTVVGGLAALAAGALFMMLRRLGVGSNASAASVVAWCFGTNAFAYATLFVAHQLVASLLLLSFAILQRCHAAPSRRDSYWIGLAGFIAAWASISEYPTAIIAVFLALYGAARLGVRAMLPFAALALPPLLLLGAYNRACFGSPFSLGYQHLAVPGFRAVIDRGFFGIQGPSAHALAELTWREFRGMLPLSPFLVGIVPGVVLLVRDRERRAEGLFCGLAASALFLLNASYVRWDGGSAIGARYAVPALPFAIVACAFALHGIARIRHRLARLATRTLSAAAIVYSVAVCTMCVAVMPEFPDSPMPAPIDSMRAPDSAHPITTLILPLFFEGHVSEKAAFGNGAIGFASLVPGHDIDAWNVGERMGLSGTASLVPLLVFWLAMMALWLIAYPPAGMGTVTSAVDS